MRNEIQASSTTYSRPERRQATSTATSSAARMARRSREGPAAVESLEVTSTACESAASLPNLTADSGRYVLRRKPPGVLLASAHAVDREFRVIKALANSDVPVATAYHLCEDDDVIGSMFYVMSFEDGRVFWDSALPEVSKTDRSTLLIENNTKEPLGNH